MPPRKRPAAAAELGHMQTCAHYDISFQPSSHAQQAGYRARTLKQLATAAALPATSLQEETFPYPLILPEDELSLDPDYPAQGVAEWLKEPDRNEVVPERNVLYVAASPNIASGAQFVQRWALCNDAGASGSKPKIEDVTEYLAAFYHGMHVRTYTGSLTFSCWTGSSSATPRYIGLDTSTERIRIRTRACPDRHYARQLNSDDLLDAVMSILPDDAYALIMLVEHDLWETNEDDFLCGRAYGASRIAVVSMARYNPALDTVQRIERLHAWPASHCSAYINSQCFDTPQNKKRKKIPDTGKPASNASDDNSPLRAALAAYTSFNGTQPEPALWLSRICRTASHELGHCLGLDHCVYFACAMQGTASLGEDVRQPPYLCPVDPTKVLRATGGDPTEHYQSLLDFSRKHAAGSSLFAAYAAWLERVLAEQDSEI